MSTIFKQKKVRRKKEEKEKRNEPELHEFD